MRLKIPSYINCDHLLPNEETLRIVQTLASSRDRMRMLSHTVVTNAIMKTLDEAITQEREHIAAWLDSANGSPVQAADVAKAIRARETPILDPRKPSISRDLVVDVPIGKVATPVAGQDTKRSGEMPWAVVDTDGAFLSGHTSRSKARAACDRSAGQKVKNVRNPNGKG
jgi:hypothetical protein